ncbi:MAG: TAXI family TRAP transporter solute-binding subunit [Bacillota bacterium]|nr:TAXI family TRAP transporter solute-binding subunit [Bacillota bacterium]MDW7676589.1 TAXI family TRAP transporter solute-binding subunit [Bacillota bacterium]
MKNKWVWRVFVLCCAVLLAAGCNPAEMNVEENDPGEISETANENDPINTTLIQESGTGLWYMLSGAIAESAGRSYPGSVINITPGSAGPNILRLNEHQTEFAITHSNLAYEGFLGRGSFDERQEEIRTVAIFYPSSAQFFLLESVGITSFDEFFEQKPKVRISMGSQGGSFASAFERIVEAYGYTLKDLEEWGCRLENKNQSDSSKMFSDGALDGFFIIASTPSPMAVENATNKSLQLVEINENMIDSIVETYGYAKVTISKDVYPFMEKDIPSFATYTFLGASSQTPKDTVYKVTRSIYENLDYIQATHAALKDLSPDELAADHGIPMHEGAERFYRETGLIQ